MITLPQDQGWQEEAERLADEIVARNKLSMELAVALTTDIGICVTTIKDLLTTKWDKAGKCSDWRNHVPDEIRLVWSNLSPDARAVAAHMAQLEADEEVWD